MVGLVVAAFPIFGVREFIPAFFTVAASFLRAWSLLEKKSGDKSPHSKFAVT
jgi:hypothetical protein